MPVIQSLLSFLLIFRERPCQDQRVSSRNDNQSRDMQQLHFYGNSRVICERAERVDGGMDKNAGNQALAAAFTLP